MSRERKPATAAALPSLSGRLVELRAALEALEEELVAASTAEKERVPDGDAWQALESAVREATGLRKGLMDVQDDLRAARLRGWEG